MTTISSSERMRMSEEKARSWLNSIDPENLDDLESVLESITESSIVDSSDSESGEEHALGTRTNDKLTTNNLSDTDDDEEQYNDISKLSKYNNISNWECIKDDFLSSLPPPRFGNIAINNSTNVVLGNIIKIKGDLIIQVNNDKDNTSSNINNKDEGKSNEEHDVEVGYINKVQQESANNKQNLRSKKSVYRPACQIIPRSRWLAMDPLDEYNYLEEPLDLVIISHTATGSSNDQPGNIGIIRDIQTFHIETRGWDDIGYNFLIGCDGNVYEGRGWGAEGAHTFGYNMKSIGITFVGCFMRKLPTARALEACKKLLQRGVEEGHLTANFSLLGHRQCISTESPGGKLYEEIQTWEHFSDKYKFDELKESDGE